MGDRDCYDPEKLIATSECDGWKLGYIGIPWPGPWPKRNGDLFVVDPEGWQAGIAWESSGQGCVQLVSPSDDRWGVFSIRFPLLVMSEKDLIRNFHMVLPVLKAQRAAIGPRPSP